VFKNTFTRNGRTRIVKGWSVKIQYQGVRQTFSLRSPSRAAAAVEAHTIYQTIVSEGWVAAARLRANARSTARASLRAVPALASKLDARHWKPRLLRRRYARVQNEFSVSIEHAGVSHYFPLGTADEEAAAARALEIYRAVVNEGWNQTFAESAREITIGLHWAAEPLAWTYATFQTVPASSPVEARDRTIQPTPSPSPLTLSNSARALNVVIVESEPGISLALAGLLQRYRAAVLDFADANRALAQVPQRRADLVLVNHSLPGLSGEEFVERLAIIAPHAARIVYSIHEDSEQLFKSTPGGASGYLLKRTPPEHLLAPIENLLAAGSVSNAAMSESVRQYFQAVTLALETGQPQPMSRLTRREKEIMDCLSKGYLDKEIASALGISAWTVHGHIKNIFEKLGVHSRIEAVLKYLHK
jgi:DNA-binding NarL/FixJ family response regulator